MTPLAENGVSEVLFTLRIFGRNNKPRHYLPQHVWQDLGRLDSLGFHTIGLTIAWRRSFLIFCLMSATFLFYFILLLVDAHNLGSETKRAAGIPMFMAIGQCGSILGSHLFPTTQGPRYM